MRGGFENERFAHLSCLAFCVQRARNGSERLRRGYLSKCERAGVRLCKGAA